MAFKLPKNIKHNASNTRLHNIWKQMKGRCYNPNNTSYNNYGVRCIKVCDEWRNDFKNFYDWAMSNGYADDLTIDRIDVNGNYEPKNCRWADKKTQERNKRSNRCIMYRGKKICVAEAVETTGIPKHVLFHRLNNGDTGEKLFRPVKKYKK